MDLTNPWIEIAKETVRDFALSNDVELIQKYNEGHSKNQIHTELIPLPFIGNKDAEIVLLNGNPGYDPGDLLFQSDPLVRVMALKNLLHEPMEYPLYLLDPAIDSPKAGGPKWWRRILRQIIQTYGISERTLANKLFCVEYFPYNSEKFPGDKYCSIADEYSKWLINSALDRGAFVIIMRCNRRWRARIPRLEGYETCVMLKSCQNVSISKGNFSDESKFSELVDILRS